MKIADDYAVHVALTRGLLRPEQLDAVRARPGLQASEPGPAAVLDALAADGLLDAAALARALAEESGLEFVQLGDTPIAAGVLARLPRTFVVEHNVIPFGTEAGNLHVAVADPLALDVIDSVAFMSGASVRAAVAAASDIRQAIARHYPAENGAAPLASDAAGAPDAAPTAVPETAEETEPTGRDEPIIRWVQSILTEAVQRRASDIHLEPLERRFRVRLRVDGVLVEAAAPPRALQSAILSRVKIMANISIAEKRLPQDGRMQVLAEGRPLDLRVSTVPAVHGESIVMRILDSRGLQLGLTELGLQSNDRQQLERLIAAPDGMLLVTGPTGSGKTTTLYTCLHHLNRPDRKLVTVEEPVEYQLAGVNQVPVDAATGLTFAAALRAMLRQAPDVVMVGEIRDRETAEIAINASLTGHLVFSTLHTNDAPSAIPRLLDLGAKPVLVAAALRAVAAQRLVRRICPACAAPCSPTSAELRALGLDPSAVPDGAIRRGRGCAACHGSGFHGRVGIFEIFLVHDEIRAMIYDNVTAARLRQQARRDGMRTMREDGLRKVLAGLTTIDEVVAVTVGDPF